MLPPHLPSKEAEHNNDLSNDQKILTLAFANLPPDPMEMTVCYFSLIDFYTLCN